MDAAKYRELLEDIVVDVSEAERSLSDLRGVERYVKSKAEGDAKFNGLLDDVQKDIGETERTISELRALEQYVLRKIGGGERAKPAAQPRPSREAASQDGSDSATSDAEQPAAAEKSSPKQPAAKDAGQGDAMQTVEFGPDGFPMG